MNDNEPALQSDPTKTPKAPRVEGENMPPAGGESRSPAASRPAAKRDEPAGSAAEDESGHAG